MNRAGLGVGTKDGLASHFPGSGRNNQKHKYDKTMPNINELSESKWLKKEDAGRGILVTIRGCEQHDLAMQGQPSDMKWCLIFDECKPMVLNATNGQIIAGFLGSDNTDDWTGKQIVLFNDPNVMYAGKRIGGLRARAPRNLPATGQGTAAARPVHPSRASQDESFENAQPVNLRSAPTSTGQAFEDAGDSSEVPF